MAQQVWRLAIGAAGSRGLAVLTRAALSILQKALGATAVSGAAGGQAECAGTVGVHNRRPLWGPGDLWSPRLRAD